MDAPAPGARLCPGPAAAATLATGAFNLAGPCFKAWTLGISLEPGCWLLELFMMVSVSQYPWTLGVECSLLNVSQILRRLPRPFRFRRHVRQRPHHLIQFSIYRCHARNTTPGGWTLAVHVNTVNNFFSEALGPAVAAVCDRRRTFGEPQRKRSAGGPPASCEVAKFQGYLRISAGGPPALLLQRASIIQPGVD